MVLLREFRAYSCTEYRILELSPLGDGEGIGGAGSEACVRICNGCPLPEPHTFVPSDFRLHFSIF